MFPRAPFIGLAALAVSLLAISGPAAAQGWDTFSYPDAGFAVQFPSQPSVSHGTYRTNAGLSLPSAVYAARQGAVDYTVTIADFAGTALEKDAVIADTVKAYGKQGQTAVDVEARINVEYGRELSVSAKDGAWIVTAIFFIGQKLYLLEGRSPAPDAKAASASLIHFQQSLQFTGS